MTARKGVETTMVTTPFLCMCLNVHSNVTKYIFNMTVFSREQALYLL